MAKETEVSILRKGGRGIAGTYANIEHHAEGVRAFVDALAPIAHTFGFKEWRQGHNIHVFITHDGQRYHLRPTYRKEGKDRIYDGISVNLYISRKNEIVLSQFTLVSHIPMLITMMYCLGRSKNRKTDATTKD